MFRRAGSGPPTGPVGSWTVTQYYDRRTQAVMPIPAGMSFSLGFETGGYAGGGTGCNHYSGQWSATGDRIIIRTSSSARGCAGINEIELQYDPDLYESTRWRVEGDTLTLTRDDGAVMVVARR